MRRRLRPPWISLLASAWLAAGGTNTSRPGGGSAAAGAGSPDGATAGAGAGAVTGGVPTAGGAGNGPDVAGGGAVNGGAAGGAEEPPNPPDPGVSLPTGGGEVGGLGGRVGRVLYGGRQMSAPPRR